VGRSGAARASAKAATRLWFSWADSVTSAQTFPVLGREGSTNPSLRCKHLNPRTRGPLPDHPPGTSGPPFDHREGMARWPEGQWAASSDRGCGRGRNPGPVHSRHQGVLGGALRPAAAPPALHLDPFVPGPGHVPDSGQREAVGPQADRLKAMSLPKGGGGVPGTDKTPPPPPEAHFRGERREELL
jgi:hypothetical protein